MSDQNNEAASAPNVGSDYAEVVARQVAQWTKERDRLQGMIDAASASQSSTPVPREGGPDEAKTIDTPEFRDLMEDAAVEFHRTEVWVYDLPSWPKIVAHIDSRLAHVARQRQESPGAAAVDAALKDAMIYGTGMYIAKPDGSAEHVSPEKFRAAVAEGVDTALPPPALTVADEPGRGHYYTAEQMAQQREAGRREQMDRVRLIEGQRDIAQATCREFSKALDEAALARQLVSEGLTDAQRRTATELLACFMSWEPQVLVLGNVRADDSANLVRYILSAAPPAKAEGMSDEQIDTWINGIGGGYWANGKLCIRRDELAVALRGIAILAQQAKGELP